MGRRGTITVSVKEAIRLHFIRQAIEKQITQDEAVLMIGVSLLQAQRIVARVRRDGDVGVAHRTRGERGEYPNAPQGKR